MNISFFHKYNTLARRGLVKPLTCKHCKNEYTLRMTEDLEPVLQCNFCNTLVQVGMSMYNDVVAVVKEHYT